MANCAESEYFIGLVLNGQCCGCMAILRFVFCIRTPSPTYSESPAAAAAAGDRIGCVTGSVSITPCDDDGGWSLDWP